MGEKTGRTRELQQLGKFGTRAWKLGENMGSFCLLTSTLRFGRHFDYLEL